MPIKVSSLGMFILDTLDLSEADWKVPDGTPDVLPGGAGLFAILGARMWLSGSETGSIVHRGSDFALCGMQELLDPFGCFLFKDTPDRLTTRSVNIYKGSGFRDFDYLTPKLRIEPKDYVGTPFMGAEWLHLVCSPDRALAVLEQLGSFNWPAKICYEPIPYSCRPEELADLKKVLPRITLFSPNHEEAAAFFEPQPQNWDASVGEVEDLARRYRELGASGDIIIRAGKSGMCGLPSGQDKPVWVAAYHTSPAKVVDVTGCGNASLARRGGTMAGLALGKPLKEAMVCGSVAASFVLEQYGIPQMTRTDQGELWNGVSPQSRAQELARRIS